MKILRFKEDFPKLDLNYFSTIRPADKKYKVEQEVEVQTPTRTFRAIVDHKFINPLGELGEGLLTHDTGAKNKKKAIAILKKIYPAWTEETVVLVVFFKKVE